MEGRWSWSHLSHTPKIFFIHALPFYLLVGAFFIHSPIYFGIVAAVFIYCIIFAILGMPMQYTMALLRTIITGKNKPVRNKDNLFDF